MKHHAPSGTSKVVLSATGLTMAYGGAVALNDLSFSLKAGKVLGLLGPNGAGKTTAIRILTTILAPTSGSFEVCGIDGRSADLVRARIGVLPESAGLPVGVTALEFMTYFGALFGYEPLEAKIRGNGLLASVGLGDKRHVLVSKFSRGMRQRLGIARALSNDPSVIFLDEPTLGLDPAGQAELLTLIKKVARENDAGVIFCSHLLSEVERLCDEVIILKNGRVAAQGPVSDIMSQNAKSVIRFRVPERAAQTAQDIIEALGTGVSVMALEDKPGWIDLSRADSAKLTLDELSALNLEVLGALVAQDIPVMNVETGQGRLEEVFLSLTRP